MYLVFYVLLLEKVPNSILLCKSIETEPIEEEYKVEYILDCHEQLSTQFRIDRYSSS